MIAINAIDDKDVGDYAATAEPLNTIGEILI